MPLSGDSQAGTGPPEPLLARTVTDAAGRPPRAWKTRSLLPVTASSLWKPRRATPERPDLNLAGVAFWGSSSYPGRGSAWTPRRGVSGGRRQGRRVLSGLEERVRRGGRCVATAQSGHKAVHPEPLSGCS